MQPIKSQFLGTVYISHDGSVTGTDKIQLNGNIYTLTGNISGGIHVQTSYVIIDGAGYTVDGGGEGIGIDLSNGRGQDPSRTQINNVTIKNLKIINFIHGIGNENTCNNTFIGNYVSDCDTGFWITGSSNNTLVHNTVKDCVTGISINYCGHGNLILENNIINVRISVWLSPEPTVDRNYWSLYLTRYPHAKEIDSSGIGDIPYNYGGSLGNYTDNHPLMEPILSSQANIPEFPSQIILILFIVVGIGVSLLVCFKKNRAMKIY